MPPTKTLIALATSAVVFVTGCSASRQLQRRDIDHGTTQSRRNIERDLLFLAPKISKEMTDNARKVETCLNKRGDRLALETEEGIGYVVEKIRPTVAHYRTGIRIQEDVLCGEMGAYCGDGTMERPMDAFGLKYERWGAALYRYIDVTEGMMPEVGRIKIGADGEVDAVLDFTKPKSRYSRHDADCIPLPNESARYGGNHIMRDNKPKGEKPHPSDENEFFICQNYETLNIDRVLMQRRYAAALAVIAAGCDRGQVYVPGSKAPPFHGGGGYGRIHGLGTIDTGSGTGRDANMRRKTSPSPRKK